MGDFYDTELTASELRERVADWLSMATVTKLTTVRREIGLFHLDGILSPPHGPCHLLDGRLIHDLQAGLGAPVRCWLLGGSSAQAARSKAGCTGFEGFTKP